MGYRKRNFRENISVRQKESMLMKSLLSDLKTDSIHVQTVIDENIRKMNALDSFIRIRYLDLSRQSNLIIFYTKLKPCEMWSATNFEPTLATLNQLESTGVLSSIEPILGQPLQRIM